MSYRIEEVDNVLRAFFNPKTKNTPEHIKKEIMEYSSLIKEIRENLTENEYKEYLEFGPKIRRIITKKVRKTTHL